MLPTGITASVEDAVISNLMTAIQILRELLSQRWISLDGWNYSGMRQRLKTTLEKINKSVLVRHGEPIRGGKVIMSEPFSAGQYCICFEMIADDGSLVIARVRLPLHPNVPDTVTEEDEAYAIACEVTTIELVRKRLPAVPVPCVYAYEAPRSQLAADAGARGLADIINGQRTGRLPGLFSFSIENT